MEYTGEPQEERYSRPDGLRPCSRAGVSDCGILQQVQIREPSTPGIARLFPGSWRLVRLLALRPNRSRYRALHAEWENDAPGLKTLEQATEIRRRILSAFEIAERSTDKEEQRRQLTFVVVGGGPTGVELAGAIGEMSRFTLAKDFRNIDAKLARVILIEAGPRILPMHRLPDFILVRMSSGNHRSDRGAYS